HFRRPERFLADLLTKSARGELLEESDHTVIWQRALVLAVDVNGGMLENPDGSGHVEHIVGKTTVDIEARTGPTNPRNSIKARIISDAGDEFFSDEDLKVFWPMLPEHISVPIKPGEHVYITFEDIDAEHGLWFGKVPGHSNVNFFDGNESFQQAESLADVYPDNPPNPESDGFVDGNDAAGGRLVGKNKAALYKDDPK
ncbi:MAG: hypothetical protein ACW99G_04060, partial [Candidatus Thorarchaeota archaeon]